MLNNFLKTVPQNNKNYVLFYYLHSTHFITARKLVFCFCSSIKSRSGTKTFAKGDWSVQLRTTFVVYLCIERSEWCQGYSQDPWRYADLGEPIFNQKKNRQNKQTYSILMLQAFLLTQGQDRALKWAQNSMSEATANPTSAVLPCTL